MTDKAYIVANKQQELDVLKKMEQDGLVWLPGDNPTDWFPSESLSFEDFPYTLIERGYITWSSNLRNKDRKIVYDGRKEEKMYKVTQEFMDELIKWRDKNDLDAKTGSAYEFVVWDNIQNIPYVIGIWWTGLDNPIENNNRLIAIIQWLNGEDVFKVEEPHKFVVRNDTYDDREYYWYVKNTKGMTYIVFDISQATKFDTREEAQEWSNSHQVVIEIDEDGNEVE